MRNHWYLTWALLATVGCAGANFPGPNRIAQQPQHPQQTQLATTQPAASQPTPGFTQRMVAAIPGMPKAAPQQNPNVVQPEQQKLDPISLGFASGPPNAALYLSMAQLSDQGGNTDHARSMYQRALSLEPSNLKALMGLARLEDREGRLNEALKVYQQALAAHPQNVQVLNDLALCHARAGQLPLSLQLLGHATTLQPQKALYRNNIAKVLIELNRVDEAAAHQAAVHPPAIAQYNMGVLLNDRGRKEEAIRFLTAATHIDPQLAEAKALLAQLSKGHTRLVEGGTSSPNDDILPTPMTPPAAVAGGAYPTTGAMAVAPVTQTLPPETAQVPIGNSPVLLPPVR
ncbi:MAG: tetratricopeptide repeat protein [Planctomycetales bacterium]|nr:tetratricopeptide repeat protein [Planctomycetales bacterium]